jgi:signal transduction histidine kinase
VRLLYAIGALAAAVHVLGYDPYNDPLCRLTCAQAGTAWSGVPAVTHVTAVLGTGALLATAGLAAGLLGWTAARVATPQWSDARVVLLAVVLAELVTAVGATADVVFPSDTSTDAAAARDVVFLSRTFALLLIGAAMVASGWLARRAATAVARLGEALSEPDHLEADLRRVLHDSGLRVQFWYPEDNSWVDVTGATVHGDQSPDRATTLARNGVVVARLVHGSGAAPSPDIGMRLSAAALLAVDNARLAVVARTRLWDIRASQARIVARGDAARRRLERDLHDGAQQQLVSVALFLRMAQNRAAAARPSDVEADAVLRTAEQRAQQLIADLREIAHGIFPAVLAEEGIAAAVLARVESASMPVLLTRLVSGRYDSAVEMAAYAVIDDALLAMSGASPAVFGLEVAERGDALQVRVTCDQAPCANIADALRDVEDRVGAVGGAFSVVAGADTGTCIEAIVPHPADALSRQP